MHKRPGNKLKKFQKLENLKNRQKAGYKKLREKWAGKLSKIKKKKSKIGQKSLKNG